MKGKLYRYLLPDWSEVKSVYLAGLTIAGWMWSGKTVLSRKIGATVEEYMDEQKRSFLYVEGRRQKDVLNYFEENRDEAKCDYIFITFDDAGRYYLSRESTTKERREEIKDFLEIRHIFEGYGFSGILCVCFNIQRFELLDKTIRNSPVVLFKSLISHDPKDLKMLSRMLGRRRFKFLRAVTSMMYFGTLPRDPEVLEIFHELGIDPRSLDRNNVKRFAVGLFADGKRKIIDFGPNVEKPKNMITVKPQEDDDFNLDSEAKKAVLYYCSIVAQHIGLKERELMKLLRASGLSFRTSTLTPLWKKAKETLKSLQI